MENNTLTRYWRIRMKYDDEELTRNAWDRNEVGIWYGGWSAKGWYATSDKRAYLKRASTPARPFQKSDFDVAQRFDGIKSFDWVVVFFDDCLHLCQVGGRMKSNPKHPLNRRREIFKYRKIIAGTKKSFRLSELPNSYMLIRPAGRSNVHQFGETGKTLIKILANSKNEKVAVNKINKVPFLEWLDLLGPTGWESFCEGYLILKEHFVPTGLSTGGTLPAVDIIGCNYRSGNLVAAQCKKNLEPIPIPPEFLEICKNFRKNTHCYFFSYGGCNPNDSSSRLRVIDRKYVERWITTKGGQKYEKLWRAR